MEMSFFSARSLSDPLQLRLPERSNVEKARRRFVRHMAFLRALLILDAIMIPLSLALSLDFKWRKLLSIREDFDFASSLLDWVCVAWLRDFFMLALIIRDARTWERARRYTCVLQSVAAIVFFYGVARSCMLDWDWQHDSFWKVVPIVAISSFTTIAISISSHVVSRAFTHMSVTDTFVENHDRMKIRKGDDYTETSSGSTELPTSSEHSDSDKHSTTAEYIKSFSIMKPYFWPSSGDRKIVVCNRVRAVSTWLCVAGSKCAILASPLFLARATDAVSDHLESGMKGPTAGVVSNIILYASLIFLSKALKELQSLLYIKVQQAAYVELADKTFVHLHSLSLDWHLRKKMGVVVRSMDRGIQAAQQVMQYVFLYLFPTLAECLAVGIIFIYHFNNFWLAILLLSSLFMYCLVTVKLTFWRKRFRAAATTHDNELHDLLIDSLVNFETIKYFTTEAYERKEFNEVVRKFQHMSATSQVSLSLLNLAQQFIMNSTLAGCMILACVRIFEDGATLGEFVAVNAYLIQTFAPLAFLGTIYNMVTDAVVDMKGFGELLAETPEIVDMRSAQILDVRSHRNCPMVEFRNVCFNYSCQPQERALTNVCLRIPRGGTAALVGSTGSGKTTITRLLYRFYDPTTGEVLINGQDASSVTQKSLRQVLGIVPQDVVMFNATIGHNIRYGDIFNCTTEVMEEVASKAELSDFIKQQANGYDTIVGERGLKLSGGEKQRLAIARCLMRNPSIVVLDEATSALDSQTEQKIQQALDVLSESRTVLAIAHRLSSVRHYDQIHVLEKGRVVEHGTHDELMSIGEVYSRMWNHQANGMHDRNVVTMDAETGSDTSSAKLKISRETKVERRLSTCPITGQMGACPFSKRDDE